MAPKVRDTEGMSLEVGQRRRCKVRGELSPTQYLSPLWAHQALWLSEDTPASLAEGQRMSHRVNVRVNNDSTEPDTRVSNTKLPLASFHSSQPFPVGRASGVATRLD